MNLRAIDDLKQRLVGSVRAVIQEYDEPQLTLSEVMGVFEMVRMELLEANLHHPEPPPLFEGEDHVEH